MWMSVWFIVILNESLTYLTFSAWYMNCQFPVFSSQFRPLICIFKHLNTNTSQVYSAVNQASRILSVKTSLPLTYRENEKKACYESNKLHHCPEEVINLNKKGNEWISRCPLSILTYLADLMLSWVLARSLAAATAQTLSPIRLNLDL